MTLNSQEVATIIAAMKVLRRAFVSAHMCPKEFGELSVFDGTPGPLSVEQIDALIARLQQPAPRMSPREWLNTCAVPFFMARSSSELPSETRVHTRSAVLAMLEAFAAHCAAAQPEQDWIPVAAKVPIDREIVLVWASGYGRVFMGWHDPDGWCGTYGQPDTSEELPPYDPTHWHALPNPPNRAAQPAPTPFILCEECKGIGFIEDDGRQRSCSVCDGNPKITFLGFKEYAQQIDELLAGAKQVSCEKCREYRPASESWICPDCAAQPSGEQSGVEEYEYPHEIKVICNQCEAGQDTFSNDAVSTLLVEIDRLSRANAGVEELRKALRAIEWTTIDHIAVSIARSALSASRSPAPTEERLFEKGERVQVNHPRYHGKGIVQYDSGPRVVS